MVELGLYGYPLGVRPDAGYEGTQVKLEAGDVLIIGPDGLLARSGQAYQSTVVGVYSTQPGFLAGSGGESDDTSNMVPLAVMGVVPVKVSTENGSVLPGDFLTSSSIPGYAMRAGDAPPLGTIIGKALESLEEETGTIHMLVMMR